jgi:hypothetical protein
MPVFLQEGVAIDSLFCELWQVTVRHSFLRHPTAMPTPRRTFRASDEVWADIKENAQQAGLSASAYLRQAAQEALSENAAAAMRHYLREATWVLVQIRNRIQPLSLRESASYPNEHRLDAVVEELRGVARSLPRHDGDLDLDLVPEPPAHLACECECSEVPERERVSPQ